MKRKSHIIYIIVPGLKSTSCCAVTPVPVSPSCCSTSSTWSRGPSTLPGRDPALSVLPPMFSVTWRPNNLFCKRTSVIEGFRNFGCKNQLLYFLPENSEMLFWWLKWFGKVVHFPFLFMSIPNWVDWGMFPTNSNFYMILWKFQIWRFKISIIFSLQISIFHHFVSHLWIFV